MGTSGDDDVSDDNDDNGNESNDDDDDNADSDASVESASGDSEDANSANGNDKATLNGLLSGNNEGMENEEDEGTEMIVSFTKATYLNMWGIFAMLLVLNGLCCLMCFKKKSVDAIEVDDRASFVFT